MKKIIKMTSLITLTAVAFLFAGCYGPNDMGMGRDGRRDNRNFNRMSEKLDLSEDQEKKLDDIRDQIDNRMDEIHLEIKKLRQESALLVEKDKLTEQEVTAQFEKYKSIFTKNETFFVKKIVEAHSILTKEQKSEIKDILD
jgi:Spy/CpxP family protein refolding chaperone